MSFEAESNSELTVIVLAYQLHFRFPVQNKIHKQKILSDTRTGILSSIAGPCDFLPARSDEFQKVCISWWLLLIRIRVDIIYLLYAYWWFLFVCLMVFNATFNNISVISWQSVLLVEETGGPGENHRPVTSHWLTLSHNVVHLALIKIQTHNISGNKLHWWSNG
jgi:hypothetical protein